MGATDRLLAGAALLLVGCTARETFEVTTEIDATMRVTGISAACGLRGFDSGVLPGGSRGVTRVAPAEDGRCRIAAFERAVALHWLRNTDQQTTFLDGWVALRELSATLAGRRELPAGTTLEGGLVLATAAGALFTIEGEDPVTGTLEVARRLQDEAVRRGREANAGAWFTHTLSQDLDPRSFDLDGWRHYHENTGSGLALTLERSEEQDQELFLLSVLELTVPLASLPDAPADLELGVSSDVHYHAEVEAPL